MDVDGFRPVTAGSSYILTGCGWFLVVADGFGGLQMVSGGWFSVVADGFGIAVFGPNAGKYGMKKLQIRTLFTQ